MSAKIYIIPTDTCYGIGCRLDDLEAYNLLYAIKGRDKGKKLAVLVPSWEDLEYETTLTPSQINFLKTYKFPFTVVCKPRDDFREEYTILDSEEYDTVGFRVAEACLSSESLPYIRTPLFLTSANKSGDIACMTPQEIKSMFHEYTHLFQEIPGESRHEPASNVISFQWTTNNLQYFRKHYPLS